MFLQQLKQHRLIAVISVDRADLAENMALAAARGGLHLLEITWTTPQAAEIIARLRSSLPQCCIGAGTLRDRQQVNEAVAAGAQFGFAPNTDIEVISAARDRGLPFVPGALSPTELMAAWRSGATAVKVFPISAVGGASYIRSLQRPLGDIPLIPTGGVTAENVGDLLDAGAIAVGMTSALFKPQWVASGDWDSIADRAAQLIQCRGSAPVPTPFGL